MSTFGVMAIKGDHSNRFSTILKSLNYHDLNNDIHFDNWAEFENYYNDNFKRLTNSKLLWKVFWLDDDGR